MSRLFTAGAGLTLVTLIASVAVPNYRVATNRSAEKRTMADIRSIATAWEARADDVHSYAVAPPGRAVTTTDLARALSPKYIRTFPRVDGWGTEYQFTANADSYSIRSLGNDHKNDRAEASGPTSNFASDIIYSDGSFVQYPEGAG